MLFRYSVVQRIERPVEHGYEVREARPCSRLDVLPGLGHFAHVQSPTAVVAGIEEFIDASHDAKTNATHPIRGYNDREGVSRSARTGEVSKQSIAG